MASPAAASRRFISLKWKTLAWVSIALTGIHVALVVQGYRDAMERFEARQALAFDARVRVLGKLIDQSSGRLARIATIVPGVVATMMRLPDFDERWQAAQLEMQLEIMQLYDASGRITVGGVPLWSRPPPALLARIEAALHEEHPSSFILCDPECLQYLVAPALGLPNDNRLIVIGVSLADVVLDFPGLSGSDVALLVPRSDVVAPSYWDHFRLAAISDAPRNEPKIRALAERAALTAIENGEDLTFDDRHYRFFAQPLASFGSLTPGYVLIFDDTSEALSDIRDALRGQLVAGFAALLAALAMLVWILNRPLNRLRKLAETLPLLALSQYAPAREAIGEAGAGSAAHTEIEVLESAAVELSQRLEALEGTVAARNQALAEKVAELKRANELNDKIFGTAPMIFAIQSQDGRIVQINAFGSQLLGYSESEMQGMAFAALLGDARQRIESADRMADVLAGRRALFEHTGPVRCVDGSFERVTWLHSRLAAQSGNFVLSVGLPDKSLHEPETLPPTPH